jgi:hypothetical protein
VELRIEFYNLFNHTQFSYRGISTDINTGPEFGHAFSDYPNDPRLIQLAAKFYF